MSGRGLVHAIFAPFCDGGSVHRISTYATLLPPEQVPAFAARDASLRASLARTQERYGACEAGTCRYALIARPAALCPGCPVPDGGAAVLLSANSDATRGEVELAVWAAAEGLEEPALARVDGHSGCWGRAECAVSLSVEDAEAREVARHASVVLLEPFDSDGAPLWTGPRERWPSGHGEIQSL